MISCIKKIFSYTEDIGFEEFVENELVKDALQRNFEIIGEAAYHLSNELKEKHGFIEWSKIQGLRHVLAHEYYQINPEILWNTKDDHLNDLLVDLETIIEKENLG